MKKRYRHPTTKTCECTDPLFCKTMCKHCGKCDRYSAIKAEEDN